MLLTFRYEGKKYAYDSVSGAVIQPDALGYKMMGAIVPPLTPVCPTSLRYELAKFDSMDVEEAYNEIYALFTKGVLYCAEDNVVRVKTEGENSFAAPGLIAAALGEVFAKIDGDIRFEGSGEAKSIATEVAARLGKTLSV